MRETTACNDTGSSRHVQSVSTLGNRPLSTPWRPVLVDEAALRAERCVLQIASDVRADQWAPERMHSSLSGGAAGLAIFFHELSRRWPDTDFSELRDRYWNAAIDALATASYVRPNLYGGFTGVGWATLWLASDEGSSDVPDEIHEELEECLLECLGTIRDPADYDLINGPAGWGLYALERWPHPRATRVLELIVDFFDQRAERVEEGVRWHTAPELLAPWQREFAPNGHYNLGLSHGMPGLWVFLAQAIVRGIRPERSQALLEGAVHWGLSQRWREGALLSFPNSVDERRTPPGTRLAWCYGDLGVAAALFVVGQVTGRSEWSQEALAIAHRASRLTREVSVHVDAGLCHGAAGAGHIFGRFYQATGDPAFAAAAAYWLETALEMKKKGTGPGGYAAWRTTPAPGWDPHPGLLEGATGVGLALLAGTEVHEPNWDRFLLISPVPMGTREREPIVESPT